MLLSCKCCKLSLCAVWSGVAPELVKQENLLHSIAAALHLSTQPITGQTATPAQLQRNAAVSVNVEQPLMQVSSSSTLCLVTSSHFLCPVWGQGTPLSIYFVFFSPFYFSLSFIGFTYFLLLSIPSLSTGIVPLHFQAGGRRRRPNLGLVCVLLCNLCYLYSLVKMDCGVLFYLV